MSNFADKEVVGIQYLRGVAALMVVLFHFNFHTPIPWISTQMQSLQSGVDIFFVISGFVMVISTFSSAPFTAPTGLEFLRKRIIRIVPLYWVATVFMILVLLVAPQLVKTSKLVWGHAIASLFFIASPNPATSQALHIPLVTPGWTLQLEMLFYLVFAIGLSLVRERLVRLVVFVAIVLGGAALYGLVIFTPSFDSLTGFYTNPIMLEFVYGMIVAVVFLSRGRAFKNGGMSVFVLVLAFALLVFPPFGDPLLRCFRAGIPAAVIVIVASFTSWPKQFILQRLGDMSYSLYLSHFFVVSAFGQIWARFIGTQGLLRLSVFYVAGTITAIAVAWLCWTFVEKPLTKAARRLLSPRSKQEH